MTFARKTYRLQLPSGTLALGQRTLVMGVINVTPDSFYSGSAYLDVPSAIAQALEMERVGADLLDVGGESTRPGADPVSAEEEYRACNPRNRGPARQIENSDLAGYAKGRCCRSRHRGLARK